jgi:hypothetical protein
MKIILKTTMRRTGSDVGKGSGEDYEAEGLNILRRNKPATMAIENQEPVDHWKTYR